MKFTLKVLGISILVVASVANIVSWSYLLNNSTFISTTNKQLISYEYTKECPVCGSKLYGKYNYIENYTEETCSNEDCGYHDIYSGIKTK